MKKALLITILVTTLFSCVSQRTKLNTWLGSSKHDLIMSWGPPDRTADDGDGGQILIYGHHVYAPNLNLNYWDYKMMYADKDGKIYNWRTTRQPVAPTEIDVRFLN